jgi:acetyl esterase/lipase
MMRRCAIAAIGLLAVACSRRSTSGSASGGRQMISFAELAATPAPPADRRVAYGADSLQFGELRVPPGIAGRRPVVVLIHGGCWRSAYDLKHTAAAADALARAGYVVWVPEYRRVGNPEGGWPGTFDDVARAVDHVRVLAVAVPSIDTTRVVLVGHSAGGQLALWAASRKPGETGAPVSSPHPLRVSGVASLAGVPDLAAFGAVSRPCNATIHMLLGGTPADVPDRYRAVSPIERLPLGVPVYLVHGSADPTVPVAQSESYAARARARGDRVELTVIQGAGHFDVMAPQAVAWTAVLRAVRALAKPLASR